jgi:hypothetical protein
MKRLLPFVILVSAFASLRSLLRSSTRFAVLAVSLCLAAIPASGQTPNLVSYQGRVAVGNVNFEGTGNFRFALVSANGSIVYWTNAPDVAPANGIPDAAVNLTVTKGLYSVLLGDTSINNMAAIPTSAWNHADIRLRVWFNDGVNGNQQLTPDPRIAPAGYFADGSVDSPAIAAGAITTTKIANNAVTAAQIANDAITTTQIAAVSVGTGKLQDGAVTTAKLANSAVDSTKIANFAVTTTQLASDAVATSKLQDGAVTTPKILNGAVGTLKIADGAVSTDKIADGAVTAAKLGSSVAAWSANGADVYRAAGNVGIGTGSPSQPLTVTGNVFFGTADNAALAFDNAGNGRLGFVKKSGSNPVIASASSAPIIFSQSSETNMLLDVADSTLTERMRIAANGNVGIGYTSPTEKLTVNGNAAVNGFVYASGEMTCVAINLTSDRNAKEQFRPVNAREVLDKVIGLPITEWQYKARDESSAESARHIGPMAQDFHAAFALGRDEKHIASVDADGVALAAIQGLNEKLEAQVQEKEVALQRLEQANSQLAERLEAIEAKLHAVGSPPAK